MTARQINATDVLPLADFPGYIVNNWYIPYGVLTPNTGANPGANSARFYPGYVKQQCTISALGFRINTLAAGGNIQAAIYANNPATMRPTGSQLVATSSITTASTGSVNAAASLQLGPGLYWFGSNCDNATAIMGAASANSGWAPSVIGSPTQGNNMAGSGAAWAGVSTPLTFGTWGDVTSATFTEAVSNTFPLVQFKIASVP